MTTVASRLGISAAVKLAVRVLLACGAALLVLGIVVWTGHGDALIPVHIAIGVVLVLALWTLAAIAAHAGVRIGTVTFAAAWGLAVAVFGMTQEHLLDGRWHWTIQVVHVVVSMGAIWWGRRLAELIHRAASEPTRPLASTLSSTR
jgi:hypothetical protein